MAFPHYLVGNEYKNDIAFSLCGDKEEKINISYQELTRKLIKDKRYVVLENTTAKIENHKEQIISAFSLASTIKDKRFFPFSFSLVGKFPMVEISRIYLLLGNSRTLKKREFPFEIKNVNKDNNGHIVSIDYIFPKEKIYQINTYDIDEYEECINGLVWNKKYKKQTERYCEWKILQE